MLGEVRLIVAAKEARLILRKGERVIEDEVWKFDRMPGQTEVGELVKAVFDNTYDMMNFVTSGDDE
jgi:hypothetical protein